MLTEIPDTPQPIKKHLSPRRIVLVFFLGALCFLITQVFTRVPLLGWLQGEPGFILWAMSIPLLSGILIALTAGVFEEIGRFAFKAFALKPARTRILEPVIFGLGHGLCEAVWMFSAFWGSISVLQPSQLVLPIAERILAITMHVGFSVMIWNGFQLDKRLCYLLLAVLAHGLVDALIPLAGIFGWGVLALEGILAGIAGLLLIYAIYSRKYYRKEDLYE
jgi:uncharacterized membrane protein YhfC